MADIGKSIMEARKRKGWSQEELALRVGYKGRSAINKIETGLRDLPQKKILQFAEALDTTPAALMGWVTEEVEKKNDDLVKVIVRLRADSDFFDFVDAVMKLSEADYASIRQLVSALGRK